MSTTRCEKNRLWDGCFEKGCLCRDSLARNFSGATTFLEATFHESTFGSCLFEAAFLETTFRGYLSLVPALGFLEQACVEFAFLEIIVEVTCFGFLFTEREGRQPRGRLLGGRLPQKGCFKKGFSGLHGHLRKKNERERERERLPVGRLL
jgi:hypothetical protein